MLLAADRTESDTRKLAAALRAINISTATQDGGQAEAGQFEPSFGDASAASEVKLGR